jgi:Rod binding domain-containing protein
MELSQQMMMDQAASSVGSRLPSIPKNATAEKIRAAGQEFEAVFATQMLKPMFEELSTDGFFGGGHAEGVFRSLMVDELGKLIAQRGELGIADTVQRELLKLQEAESGGTAMAAAGAAAAPTAGEEIVR